LMPPLAPSRRRNLLKIENYHSILLRSN
jgi:hypothetical protein